MLVLEAKLKGKTEQYNLIDEAIRTFLFVRNKAVVFQTCWIRESNKNGKTKPVIFSTLQFLFAFQQVWNTTQGLITPTLFTIMVIMAIVTTLMCSPLVNFLVVPSKT